MDTNNKKSKKNDEKLEKIITEAGKEDKNWWGEFLLANSTNKKIREVLIVAIDAGNEINKDGLEKMRELIDKLPASMKQEKNVLERRFTILEKREERRVTEDFGSLLKYYRNLKGMSLSELGEATNISPSYINRIETGRRNAPSYPILIKIAEALDISILDLLGEQDQDDNDKREAMSLTEIIYSGKIYIKDKDETLTKKDKKCVVELIEYIYNAEWKDNKHKEAMGIIEIIDNIKNK